MATGASGLSWLLLEWLVKGKPTVLGLISGAVSGLVVITPASGFVDMTGAFLMGVLGGAPSRHFRTDCTEAHLGVPTFKRTSRRCDARALNA